MSQQDGINLLAVVKASGKVLDSVDQLSLTVSSFLESVLSVWKNPFFLREFYDVAVVHDLVGNQP